MSMLRLFAHQLGIGVCPKYQVLLIIHLLYKHHDGWVIWYVALKDFRFLDSGPNMKYPRSTFGTIWLNKWFMKRSALLGWYFFRIKNVFENLNYLKAIKKWIINHLNKQLSKDISNWAMNSACKKGTHDLSNWLQKM